MKGIIVREITSLVFQTPSAAAAAASSSSSTPQNKHIRFGDDTTEKKAPAVRKPSKNPHVQYYAVITLNQIVLAPDDQAVALQLINIYFDIFRDVLGETPGPAPAKDEDEDEGKKEVKVDSKGRILDKTAGKKAKRKPGDPAEVKGAAGFVEVEDANSRLISAILTGVNRALPYAKLQSADSECVPQLISVLFSDAIIQCFQAH